MDYDENVFKAKANIKARRIWLVFASLLSANYGTDVGNGVYPGSQYIIFLILCWVPFFAGEILLKVDGKTTDRYRFDLFIGYGIFYTFLICTTASPIAFTYILPVVSILVLYKSQKFMIGCGIANTASVIVSIIYRAGVLGFTSAADVKNYQLHHLVLYRLCYVDPPSGRVRRCPDRQDPCRLAASDHHRGTGKSSQQHHYERYYRCP